jgi:flagellar hook assembly protein FlgD
VVDLANYSDEMHMELLDDPRGISLERVSVKRSGQDRDNWHSAASIAGFATPGRENSQSNAESDSELLLDVSTEVFSPDNDGFNDVLEIYMNLKGNDWVIGLVISDLQGNRIRVLANNHLAAPSVTYTWDGEGANGEMLPMGFYVIHARGYRPQTGEQWVRRKAVGLVYR